MTTLLAVCGHVDAPTLPLGGVEVVLIDDLCTRPGRLPEVAHGATALVLALCSQAVTRREFQSAARRTGVDALAVQFLDVGAAAEEPARLAALAAGAVERVARFAGSRPEHAKPTFPGTIGRRSFLRLPLPEYVAVPAVEQDRCAAREGCTACTSACPNDAYRWAAGRVEVDPSRCEPCGLCLTVCPTGAASNPAWTASQLRAEVRGLVAGAEGPAGVVLVCMRATTTETASGWFPVAVPCTGMLTAGWALAPLLLGAHGVAVRGCSDTGCPLGNDALAAGAVELGRRLLTLSGLDADMLGAEPTHLADASLGIRDDVDVFTALGEHQVVRALVEAGGSADGAVLADPHARVGQVRLGAACTLCGACAAGCPTDALSFEQDGASATLSFDAARCTACEQCLARCPEQAAGAIAVEHVIDLSAIADGPQPLLRDDIATCTGCGKPFGSQRLLQHVGALLGEEHAAMYATVGGRCLDCRSSLGAWS